jgi:hypothetical protein
MVHVSLASPDADPASTHQSAYQGSPISIFPTDDLLSLLGPTDIPLQQIHFSPILTDVPGASDPVTNTMSLLLKGFDTLFATQDQDHVVDREDHHRFENNMQDMLHERLSHNSIVSASVIAPMSTPVGKYCTDPNMIELSSLSPNVHSFPILPPMMQCQPPSHDSMMPYASHHIAFDSITQEYPFLANMTKTSLRSKFNFFFQRLSPTVVGFVDFPGIVCRRNQECLGNGFEFPLFVCTIQ